MSRAAAGDRRAFALLVTRHAERVRAVALRFSGNAADADDVTQQAFFAAWREAANWQRGRARFGTWIYRVAVNRCIDLSRRRRVRSLAEPRRRRGARGRGAGCRRPRRAAQRAGGGAARDILALPEKQRAALLLAVQAEKGTAEIGAALGVSAGAAEQLLVRARRTLRERARERMQDGPVGARPEADTDSGGADRRGAAGAKRAEERR
ncbi:MAG: sigma-70 family RNA polymerase sigma factor [Alphaproteobacteria bacterium]